MLYTLSVITPLICFSSVGLYFNGLKQITAENIFEKTDIRISHTNASQTDFITVTSR